jgi:hypothetical protein
VQLSLSNLANVVTAGLKVLVENGHSRIKIDDSLVKVYLAFLSNGMRNQIQKVVNGVESQSSEGLANSLFKVLKAKSTYLNGPDFLYVLKICLTSRLRVIREEGFEGDKEMKGTEVNEEIRRILFDQWLAVSTRINIRLRRLSFLM